MLFSSIWLSDLVNLLKQLLFMFYLTSKETSRVTKARKKNLHYDLPLRMRPLRMFPFESREK